MPYLCKKYNMNIHFEDKILFEKLKSATIVRCLVGSRCYGTHTLDSDHDYLYIYATSENELNSFITTHHQFIKKKGTNNGNLGHPRKSRPRTQFGSPCCQ